MIGSFYKSSDQNATERLKLPLPPHIEAVVFDLDGTLYRQWPVRLRMALQLAGWVALHPVSGLTVVRLLRNLRRAQEALRRPGAHEAAADVGLADMQTARAALGVRVNAATSRRIVNDWMFERPLRAVRAHARPELEFVLRTLRERGMKLGVCSDYPGEAKLQAMGIRNLFDVLVSSYDTNVASFKPHPAGLRHALDLLGVEPARAIYVGDRVDTDTAGARAAGMQSVIVRRSTRLRHTDRFTSIRTLKQLVE